jgi:hypothetical protein
MSRESIISDLSRCLADFDSNLSEIANCPASGAPLDPLKQESVRITLRISDLIDQLKTAIRQDGQIAANRRSSVLSSILSDLSLNVDELSARRRSTVKAATEAISALRAQSAEQARKRLLGDEAALELKRTASLRNRSSSALAAEITARLTETRNLIEAQVTESQHSLELMQESTAELSGVGEAADRVEIAQGRAARSLIRLRIAQNWDRWLLNSALIFFSLVVAYVVYRGLTRNMIVLVVKLVVKGIKKVVGWAIPRKTDAVGEGRNATDGDRDRAGLGDPKKEACGWRQLECYRLVVWLKGLARRLEGTLDK